MCNPHKETNLVGHNCLIVCSCLHMTIVHKTINVAVVSEHTNTAICQEFMSIYWLLITRENHAGKSLCSFHKRDSPNNRVLINYAINTNSHQSLPIVQSRLHALYFCIYAIECCLSIWLG